MQLAAPQPRRHKVLMSFRYWNTWDVIFFDTDRMRTALPRRARFNSDQGFIAVKSGSARQRRAHSVGVEEDHVPGIPVPEGHQDLVTSRLRSGELHMPS